MNDMNENVMSDAIGDVVSEAQNILENADQRIFTG